LTCPLQTKKQVQSTTVLSKM